MDFVKVARSYLKNFGFSVIPVGRNKNPLLPWLEYQTRKASEDEIKTWADKWPSANIGIVTGKISRLAVIDIDEECGYDAIGSYVSDSLSFPVVKTPSGGQHWYFRIGEDMREIRNNARTVPGCDLRAEGGFVVAPPSEGEKGKYEWLKDAHISKIGIPELPEKYIEFVTNVTSVTNVTTYNKCHRMSQDVTTLSHDVTTSKMFIPGTRDNDLFHTANCLVRGGMPEDEILQVLQILGQFCRFPETEIQKKIKSALDRAARRERNLLGDIEEFLSITSGEISVSQCYNALQIISKEDKAHLRQILHRKCGTSLEKHPVKGGVYRIKDNSLEVIDWRNAGTEEIPLKMPLNVTEFVKILPKNLVVVAGAPNAGKTAFLLNIVRYNMDKYPINYFSSEMAESELKSRLACFEDVPASAWNFQPYNRSSNFADVIVPDEINIIDFLELHDEFWKVGSLFKEIYEKLTTGIAIIAIQKKRGADVGKGGDITLEKPRLYINLDAGVASIAKGKNWRGIMNPNGLKTKFKLVQGCKFIQEGIWDYD